MMGQSTSDFYLVSQRRRNFLAKVRKAGRKHGKQFTMLRMGQDDVEVLEKRPLFMEKIGNLEKKFEEGKVKTEKMSDLNKEISFLYSLLTANSKSLS